MWSIAACELSKMADPPPPMQPIVYHIDHKIEEVKEEEEDETEEEVEEEEEDESEEEVEEGKEDEAGGQPQKANRIMRDGAICSININTDHEKWIEEMIKDYPGAGRESPSPGETKINLGEGNDMTLLRQTFKRMKQNRLKVYTTVSVPSGNQAMIHFGHLNIRSARRKADELKRLLQESHLDLACFTESWLIENSPANDLEVDGFRMFRKDREAKKGGGVLFYVRNTLGCEKIDHPSYELECIALKITPPGQEPFSVIGIYRPPNAKVKFYDQLDEFLKCFENEIILFGDLNINWTNEKQRKNLKKIADKYGLRQIIKGPTRITTETETQIDLAFTNRLDLILMTENLPTAMSDHNIILFTRYLCKPPVVKAKEWKE